MTGEASGAGSMDLRKSGWLLVPLLSLSLAATPASAQIVESRPSSGEQYRFAGALGFSSWSDLGDLQPDLGGDFDETGFGLDGSFHARVGQVGPVGIMVGIGAGILSHASSVRGAAEGEDLVASVLYLAPSVQLDLTGVSRHRFFLDGGVGYYAVSLDEWEDSCFWSCDVFEYYSDSGAGGYVGVGADFEIGSPGGVRISTAIRAHFVDFDDPEAVDPAGRLGGPIYQFQVGLAWGM